MTQVLGVPFLQTFLEPMAEDTNFVEGEIWVQIPALPLTSSVALS